MTRWAKIIRPRIEQLVVEKGLRKDHIYNKLGVDYRQFRNYEKGESLIPMDRAYVLCELLDCKVDDLYERIVEEEYLDK